MRAIAPDLDVDKVRLLERLDALQAAGLAECDAGGLDGAELSWRLGREEA